MLLNTYPQILLLCLFSSPCLCAPAPIDAADQDAASSVASFTASFTASSTASSPASSPASSTEFSAASSPASSPESSTASSTASSPASSPASSTEFSAASSTASSPESSTATSTASSAASTSGASFMTLDCTIPEVTDARIGPAERWAAVKADEAWAGAIQFAGGSQSNSTTGGLSWSELISNFVHGPEQMQCDSLSAQTGCGSVAQCWNYPAAGFFITNSLHAIYSLNHNIWEAVSKAEADVTTQIGVFSSTFSVQEQDLDHFLIILLDTLGLGFALYAAPVWNIAFKKLPYFASHGNELGTIKDTANSMVASSITLVKDSTPAAKALNTQNTLSSYVGKLVEAWSEGIDAYNKQLFDGSLGSVGALNSLIADGKVIAGDFGIDEAAARKQVQQALYASIIPQAWLKSNAAIHPFILDSGAQCGTKDPVDKKYLVAETGDKAWSCVDDKIYYLLTATGRTSDCWIQGNNGAGHCTYHTFGLPPGAESLDGDKWGGLTRDDVITGAVKTFNGNGNKNGASTIDLTNEDSIKNLAETGVRTPGIVTIPVCSAQEAYSNWASGKTKNDNYPCN